MALRKVSRSNRIDVVFDTHREISTWFRDGAPVTGYHKHTDREAVEEFPDDVINKTSLIIFIVSE